MFVHTPVSLSHKEPELMWLRIPEFDLLPAAHTPSREEGHSGEVEFMRKASTTDSRKRKTPESSGNQAF
jgi:hypothetical protein